MLKKLFSGMIASLLAVSAWSADWEFGGDFKNESLWEQNKGEWNKPWGTFKFEKAADGATLVKVTADKASTPLCNRKTRFPVKLGDKIEVEVTVKGTGKVEFGLYSYSSSGGFGGSFIRIAPVTADFSTIKATFTIAKTREVMPDYVVVAFGAAANSDLTFSNIAARLVSEGAPVPAAAIAAPAAPRDKYLLEDFSSLQNWTCTKKNNIELATDNGNQALKLTLPATATGTPLAALNDTGRFADAKGLSFRVKGDGQPHYLPVSVAGLSSNTGSWRYTAYVPVKGSDWQTVTLAWDDFLAPRGATYGKLGSTGGLTPAGIGTVVFGDRWEITHCNAKIEPFTVLIDDVRMVDQAEAKPFKTYPERPLADVIAKMKAGKDVLIYCSGDSITAGTSVADPDQNRYGVVLEGLLRKAFNNDKIKVRTIAVGGAHTYDLRTWVGRDFENAKPDLVTLHIGYNDKSGLVTPDAYRKSVEEYLELVKNETAGSPAFLLLATIPGQYDRYTMMDDFADVIRQIGKDKNIAVYDLAKDFKALGRDGMAPLMADMAHPNNDGHKLIAEKIAGYLAGK